MKKGLFITFEGIDGCGKSTQSRLLATSLESIGLPVLETREPGGTAISEKIRSLLIDPAHREMVNECELLLYLAARAQHVKEKIIPALNNGIIVISDRFHYATLAYQGFGRGISLDTLQLLHTFAAGILPDIAFFFDIPVPVAFERLTAIQKGSDRLESSGIDFYTRIREGYLSLAKTEPDRITLLDGQLPVEILAEQIFPGVLKKIEKA